jgi:sugar lactone lactonase YvrE
MFLAASAAGAQPTLQYPGYTIELLATGFGAATGMAFSPSGDLYVTDDAGMRVLRVQDPASKKPRKAEVYATGITYPNDLTFAFPGKNKKKTSRLLVTAPSSASSPIVEVRSDGSTGVFAQGFSYPVGIATSGDYVYVANSGDGTIRRMRADATTEVFVSGFGGPHGPFGLSFDGAGNLYFVVHGTGQVFRAYPDGSTTLLGAVAAFGGVFVAATQDGSRVFVADVLQGSIYVIDGTGANLFATGFAGKSNPPFNGPNDIVLDRSGNMYVADADKVWRISRAR